MGFRTSKITYGGVTKEFTPTIGFIERLENSTGNVAGIIASYQGDTPKRVAMARCIAAVLAEAGFKGDDDKPISHEEIYADIVHDTVGALSYFLDLSNALAPIPPAEKKMVPQEKADGDD